MQTQTTSTETAAPTRGNVNDHDYASFLARVQARFIQRCEEGATLFETDAEGLWEAYLEAFPAKERQYHNCSACRRFIQAYGGLVVITANGTTASAIWDLSDADAEVDEASVADMLGIVRGATVRGPFLSPDAVLGIPLTGDWRHLALAVPPSLLYRGRALTAGQAMAEKRQDFLNVVRALGEYKADAVNQALALLKSETLYRGEKVLGQAQFLADLHAAVEAHPHRRQNMIWRLVGPAPAGFCHPRASMIGTLLDDIAAGVPFDVASRKFADKMNPLGYQRPQVAPTAGNIAQAEKRFAELGLAPALKRRFARLDEIETVWRPDAPKPAAAGGGVFGHLQPKGEKAAPAMTPPWQAITWEKFARVVLPDAAAIDLLVPSSGAFMALLTAVDPSAPPILQWDSEEKRNPFSWYVYPTGSSARQWGLVAGDWVRVNAITLQPSMWGGGSEHHGRGAVLVLEGARDSRGAECGGGLFPEILKSELRDVRATIEAYSRAARLEGLADATANGLRIQQRTAAPQTAHVRVRDRNGVTLAHLIDRWD